MENKRFLLFGNREGLSRGGFNDFMDASSSLQELYKKVIGDNRTHYEFLMDDNDHDFWWHIVDDMQGKIIMGSLKQPQGELDLKSDIICYEYIEHLDGVWSWFQNANIEA